MTEPSEEETPNAETIAALKEAEAGGGEIFEGSTQEAFDSIMNGDD